MENLILSKYFILTSLLVISILYCMSAGYLIYVSALKRCIDPDRLLIIVSLLYFILAFSLTCVLYSQEDKKIYNPEVNQNDPIPKVLVPEIKIPKNQNALTTELSTNALFLKIYLKTYYKKVPDEIEGIIIEAVDNLSHKHHIDFGLVVGIIGVESSFNPYATSKVGARGLMQVRYGVWKDHLEIPNIMELHNIHKGIEYGMLAFLQCRKEAKGNLVMALQRYSGTKGQVYVDKVNKEIDRFVLLKK